jgi:hypothetical protein
VVDDEALKDAFKRAAEIAQGVPDEFRKDAFNRALDSLLGGGSAPAAKRRRRSSARPSVEETGGGKSTATTQSGASRPRRTAGRPGPKQALLDLKTKGYFSTKRTISEVRDYLQKKRGYNFTLQDLSPTLLSLVRSGDLDRDKNAESQYEYKAP